jgi:hypothetical protein
VIMGVIGTAVTKQGLIKNLNDVCENIKADATEIFNSLDYLSHLTITIEFSPASRLTYKIEKIIFAHSIKEEA